MSFFEILYDVARPTTMKDLQQIESLYKAVKDTHRKGDKKTVETVRSTLKKPWLEQIETELKNRAKRLETATKAKTVMPKDNIEACEKEVFRRFREEHKKGLTKVNMVKTQDAIAVLLYEMDKHRQRLTDMKEVSKKAPTILKSMKSEHEKVRTVAGKLGGELKKLVKVPAFSALQADVLVHALHCDEIAHNAAEVISGCGALITVHATRVKEVDDEIDYLDDRIRTVKSSAYWEDIEAQAL